MDATAHEMVQRASALFDSQRQYAEAMGLQRTTVQHWLNQPVGALDYPRMQHESEDIVARVLAAVHSKGFEDGAGASTDADVPHDEEWARNGDKLHTIRNVGDPVHSEAEAARFFDVDRERWVAEKIDCGQHEVPLKLKRAETMDVGGTERLITEEQGVKVRCYRLSVRWRRAHHRQAASAFVRRLLKDVSPSAPDVPAPTGGTKRPTTGGLIRNVEIPDLHLGNLIWSPDGEEVWNLDIGARQFRAAYRYFVGQAAEEGVTRILLTVGSDAAHANSSRAQSASGTQYVHTAPAYHTADRMAELYLWAAKYALERGLCIDFAVVRGNHDWDPAAHMGRALWIKYQDNERVRVYRSPDPWLILRYGDTLLLKTHGKNKGGRTLASRDLYELMASRSGSDWHDARYKEAHTGHRHKRDGRRVGDYDEHKGVLCRTMPTLCPPDAYHRNNLYIDCLRGAEAHDYHPEHGLVRITPYIPDLLRS